MNPYIMSSLIVLLVTKAADIWTTKKNITSSEDEQVLLGRALFEKFGIGPGLAIVSIVYLSIVGLYAVGLEHFWGSRVAYFSSTFGIEQSICEAALVVVNCVVLLFVSLIQAQVAYCNSHRGTAYPQPMRWTIGILRRLRVLA